MDSVTKTQRNVNPQINPWAAKITVLGIQPNNHPGNVRAFAKVALGPLVIHGVKITMQPGQRAYVRLPEVQSGGGWYPVLSCTDDQLQSAIAAAVLEAWQNGGAA